MYSEAEVKQALAALMGNKQALAEFIVEWIEPNHLTNEFMNILLDTRQLNIGDMLVKKIRKGLTVRTWTPGTNALTSQVAVTEHIAYVLDHAIIGVTYNQLELENGDIGTVQSLRREMVLKLRDYYFNKVFTALSTVWNATNTPDNYTDVGGPITATALEDAIDRINYLGGAKVVFGTKKALTPITKFTNWTDSSSDNWPYYEGIREVMQTGWLGKWYGVPIVGVDQIFDDPESNTPLLPEDKILVVGKEVGEFITYGPVRVQEHTDTSIVPPQWHMWMYQSFGFMITHAEGIYVLKVS